jgi:predicted Rossmann fold flavoprotein
MAAIWAGRARRGSVALLDGARTLGAKILVSGGGRCNVTHQAVDETAFAGSSRHAIRRVLRRFDVPATVAFFRELGVELKREETGKLFPVTDRARTVLDALVDAARGAGVELRHPWRVAAIEPGFVLTSSEGEGLQARRVVLATGGRSLPRSGSDGAGYTLARALGHTVTARVFPALVPLTLPPGHPLCALSGLSAPATLEVRGGTGRRLATFTGSTLCAHFGLSGPAVLDVSRHFLAARFDDPNARLFASWLPGSTVEAVDEALRSASPARLLGARMPERLARALCGLAGVSWDVPAHQLTRQARRSLAKAVAELPLPVTGDRGFDYAEVTAGGVPLGELDLATMESRACPGLFLCGEICDVDGRIGGFNFQWAWASGYVAGTASLARADPPGRLTGGP